MPRRADSSPEEPQTGLMPSPQTPAERSTGGLPPGHPWEGPAFAQACGVTSGRISALLTFPTGSGKTWLSIEAARATVQAGHRVMVIVPIRALAYEVETHYRQALPGQTIRAFTSERRQDQRKGRLEDCAIIIVTPERADLISRNWRRNQRWLSRVTLIVADEIHHLADPHRGARYDAALTRLRMVLPLVNVLALTATCGNPHALADWIGGPHFAGGTRPVPQHWTLHRSADRGGKAELLKRVLRPGHATQVFVHARKRTTELQSMLEQAGFTAAAYHAGLTPEARAAAEARYRAGTVQVLICTSAMESGVNLPTRDVVLYDVTMPLGNGTFERISVNSAWQRAGRAGRSPGQTDAHIHVFESGKEQAAPLLTSHFEPLHSPLGRPGPLLDFILGSLDGGYGHTRAGLARLLGRTLAAHQGRVDLTLSLDTLLQQTALEEHDGRLSVTPLGRIASQALLSPASLLVRKYLREDATVFDVLMQASRTPDLPDEPRLDPDSEPWVDAALETMSSRMLDDGEQHMTSPLRALIARRACEVGDLEAAGELGLDVPYVTALREAFIRILGAWERWRPGLLNVRLALTMLAAQLPLDAATLALIPGIGRARARQLAQNGVPHLEALAQSTPDDLAGPGVSPAQAARWIALAEATVDTWTSDPTREPAPGQRNLWGIQPHRTADPLRLRRAADLQVEATPGPDGTVCFTVTGGSQARHVQPACTPDGRTNLRCDCPDWRPARACKHVLAVRLHTGHPETTAELSRLQFTLEDFS